MVVGDRGTLVVRHLRNDRCKILISNRDPRRQIATKARRRALRYGVEVGGWPLYKTYSRPSGPHFAEAGPDKPVDFMLGPQDMVDAIQQDDHIACPRNWVSISFRSFRLWQYPERFGYRRDIKSSFEPSSPFGNTPSRTRANPLVRATSDRDRPYASYAYSRGVYSLVSVREHLEFPKSGCDSDERGPIYRSRPVWTKENRLRYDRSKAALSE